MKQNINNKKSLIYIKENDKEKYQEIKDYYYEYWPLRTVNKYNHTRAILRSHFWNSWTKWIWDWIKNYKKQEPLKVIEKYWKEWMIKNIDNKEEIPYYINDFNNEMQNL